MLIPESSSSCGMLEGPSTSTFSFLINPSKVQWGHLSELDMFSQHRSYFVQFDHRTVYILQQKPIIYNTVSAVWLYS